MSKEVIFKKIYQEVAKVKQIKTPLTIGVNGLDYAGKTQFSTSLAQFFQTRGYSTLIIHVDDFYNGSELNYLGSNMPEYYFRKSYELDKIVSSLLKPLKREKKLQKTIQLWNDQNNKYDLGKAYYANFNSMVIIEGVFLFQPKIIPLLDFKIFLSISIYEAERRALLRNSQLKVSKVLYEFRNKFVPAQKVYIEENNPIGSADMVLLNEDWNDPKEISSP